MPDEDLEEVWRDIHPYRVAPEVPHVSQALARPRTWRGRWRSFVRRMLLGWEGRFLVRYPATCPCGKRSWDPMEVRRNFSSMNAGQFSHRANVWRCGQRHGLHGRVVLG
jgi:hypothetical protein